MSYLLNIDNSILSFFSVTLKNKFFDAIMPIITNSNNHGEVWIVIAVILILNKNTSIRRAGISMLIAVALGYLIGEELIKNIVGRVRPVSAAYNYKFIITPPTSYSFPSGHTTSSFAAFGASYFSKIQFKYWLLALAALIAFSRMYLHVHYPSDVLGGIILGLICAKAGVYLGNVFYRKKERVEM